MAVIELCPVCHLSYDCYLRCYRPDCHDGRMPPLRTTAVQEATAGLAGAIALEATFRKDLAGVLQRHGKGVQIGIPVTVLAEYLSACIGTLGSTLSTWRKQS